MSTISAGLTVNTGLNWSSDTSGNLVFQSNSVSTLTLSNAAIIMADSTQFNTVNSFTMRNRLINGDMRIDQRNNGVAQTITAAAALAYTVDRWYAYSTGASVTGQRVANTALRFAYQFTGAASTTAIGFAQRIETANSYDLNGTTVTLSAYLANSLLTTVAWTAYYATTADTFGTLASPTRTQIATGTFTVSSTLTRYATNIAIPSAATTGIEIVFTVGAQISGTWTIGAVQLEPGTVATPFERRSYATELVLSQRYFFSLGGTALFEMIGTGTNNTTTTAIIIVNLPVQMRVAPTISTSGSFFVKVANTNTAVSLISTDTSALQTVSVSVTSTGLTVGNGNILFVANNLTARFQCLAELT